MKLDNQHFIIINEISWQQSPVDAKTIRGNADRELYKKWIRLTPLKELIILNII